MYVFYTAAVSMSTNTFPGIESVLFLTMHVCVNTFEKNNW